MKGTGKSKGSVVHGYCNFVVVKNQKSVIVILCFVFFGDVLVWSQSKLSGIGQVNVKK